MKVFMRFNTECGPRTQVFTAADGDARLLADHVNFEQIVLLPDAGPYLTIAQMVVGRMKLLDKEIAKNRRKKPKIVRAVNAR